MSSRPQSQCVQTPALQPLVEHRRTGHAAVGAHGSSCERDLRVMLVEAEAAAAAAAAEL